LCNQTEECNYFGLEPVSLTDAINEIINSTKFIGKRGEYLNLFQTSFPDDPSTNVWIYGFSQNKDLSLLRFQWVDNSMVFPSFSGKWVDTVSYPIHIEESEFKYPKCTQQKTHKANKESITKPFVLLKMLLKAVSA
jgi:hypothetical protein